MKKGKRKNKVLYLAISVGKMTGRDGSHAWTGGAQMGLQKRKGTIANFCGQMMSEAEPTSVILIPICSFCLTLSESAWGWQRSLNQAGVFALVGWKQSTLSKKQIEHSCSQMGKQASHSFQREHPCQARMSSGSSCTGHFSTLLLLNRKWFKPPSHHHTPKNQRHQASQGMGVLKQCLLGGSVV